MKRWLIALLVLAVAVGAVVFWLASSLDGTVEKAIERVGSDLLQR